MADGKRVSSSSKDEWELTGNRQLTLKVVDLQTGESANVQAIIDMDHKQLSVKCRICDQWGVYLLKTLTQDQKASGLCPNCFKKENNENIILAINAKGELVTVNQPTGEEQSAILTEEEIKNYELFLYPDINYTIVPCGTDPFKYSTELLFVDEDSDYAKAIHNASVRREIAQKRAYEAWKGNYPEQLIELLSWDEEEVSEKKFSGKFKDVPSASGKRITTTFLNSMRQYCGFPVSSFLPKWQGFEFSVRDTIGRWEQLDPRRFLIYKINANTFSYNEIDTLGIGSKVNVLLDAKSFGGIIEKSQMLSYLQFFERIGLTISKGVFVTTDDEFCDLGNNVFQMPFEWFQFLKSVDDVDLLINRLTGK